MQIRVGITTNDLTGKTHTSALFSGLRPLTVEVGNNSNDLRRFPLRPGATLSVKALGSKLVLSGTPDGPRVVTGPIKVKPANPGSAICLPSLSRAQGTGSRAPSYRGEMEVSAVNGKLRLILISDLEDYLQGVLASEIPSSYQLEAIKAQAVAARTYALRPRISHEPENFQVCDSYLCCQYFVGITSGISHQHEKAIEETRNQVLVYQEKPILALFSSCAGGHTESYENCFSDPITGQFPAPALPYLKGVAEGKLPQEFPRETALRQLWNLEKPDTCDGWSPHFRWQVRLSDSALEGHMHHVVATMLADPEFEPFIKSPPSGQFGHIDRFEIPRRGVSGVAVEMIVQTSTGPWSIQKELVIRSAFKNPDLNLSRLKSARIFLDQRRNKLGLLSELTISGLGWGHGVGLQQTGAQGLALQGKAYREILGHYFAGATIASV